MPSSIAPSTRDIPAGNDEKGKIAALDDTSATGSLTDLGEAGSDEIGSARTPWYGTSLVLMADIMGTGVLSLPFVATTLGWTTMLISLPLFAIFSAYAGYQLKVVKLAHPEINSYAEAGRKLVGPRFGTFTQACMLLNWGALAIYFLIATTDGIASVYDQGFLSCNLNRTIIAAILLVLPTQARDFHTISKFLSLPSTLAIIIVLVIVIVTLIESMKEDDIVFAEDTIVGVKPGTSVFDFLQSLSSIVFAYQGQSIFMELMTEMKNPKEFTKSLSLAYIVMGSVYTTIVVIAYGVDGDTVEGFLPDSVSPGVAKTTIGVLLVFHIMVAYVIAIQPFHYWLHSTLFPKTFNSPSTKGRVHWLLITVGYIFFSWVIVNVIPFFADLQSLIGASLGAPIVFGWPSLYYLLTIREKTGSWRKTILSINSVVSLICLFVITALFCILGTWGSILALIEDVSSSGRPFHC